MAPVENHIGFWGQPTSTLDWCENNYEVSYYVAEFWNTITNISMIIPPIKCIYEVYQQKFESRFIYLYMLLLITGIGSWMFHMTLLYEMQLLDELPMIWGSSYMVYVHYKIQIEPERKTRKIGAIMLLYAVVVTAVYLINKNPIFHEAAFGTLVVTLTIMDIRINMKQRTKQGWRIFTTGFCIFLLGFLLWNIDNHFCQNLKNLRNSKLNPIGFGPMSQLHGWWHILVGYGNHLHFQACIYHRQTFLKEEVDLNVTLLGYEVKRKEAKAKLK